MKALVTGASSGIGQEIALYLSELGYDLVLVARSERALRAIQKEIKTKCEIVAMDLTDRVNVWKLHEMYKNDPGLELIVNDAGFGVCGYVDKTDLQRDLELIDLNITATYMLTKLFLADMKKRNFGYILNVSSIAGFMDGPLMANYYASKNFVLSFSRAIHTELKKTKSDVHISVLCPGPTETNFNNVAGVKFKVKPYRADFVAEYGVNKMFDERLVIVPGFRMKFIHFMSKIIPGDLMRLIAFGIQKKKKG